MARRRNEILKRVPQRLDGNRKAGIAPLVGHEQRPREDGLDVGTRQTRRVVDQLGGRAGVGLRGASTITQQVAKNLFLWNGRSFVRKGLEAWFALLIEALWPKRRILEMYLNVAQFGPDVFGVEAAAQRYFGVAARELTPAQAALLAAVLPSPRRFDAARPSDYVRERQAWVLAQMELLDRRGHYRGLSW
jgi:monofunctional biosynthetic peptidoglycan transglycosylase